MALGLFRWFKKNLKRRKVDPALPPSPDILPDDTIRSHSTSNEEHGPSFFQNAHDFTIQKQTIIVGSSSKTLFDHFQDHIAVGAAHNSEERSDAPKCHPETRRALQEEIMTWITHGELEYQPRKILWLTGPAGTGKTAIAGSVAEACQERGLLAGSFFFSSVSSSDSRRSKRYVVSTLAYQIAISHPELRAYASRLAAVIEGDPTIFRRRLKDQAQALLLGPLSDTQRHCDPSSLPKVIVVDGLDEVEADQHHDPTRQDSQRRDEDDQAEILSILTSLALDPVFPFRILICSRPERIIDEHLVAHAPEHLTTKLFLDFKYDPDSDIELYLKSKLSEIRRRYGLSASWPPQRAIKWIVDRASGHFIFATTIMRFVADPSDLPQAQLQRVLDMQLPEGGGVNPFGPLDSLYMQILSSSPRPKLAVQWIRTISEPSEAVQLARPAFIWRLLLEETEGEAKYIMGNLASLISITDDPTPHFKIYHKSLLDFLSDKTRCAGLFVEKAELHLYIADKFVALLKNKGPKVPCSQEDWKRFLRSFGMAAKHFICFIGPPSIEALASCDVSWWTRTILAGSTRHPPLYTESGSTYDLRFCRTLFPFLVELHKCSCRGAMCDAACIHWTRGVLAELKAIKYCVHELEELLFDSQDGRTSVPTWTLEAKIKPMYPRSSTYTCAICDPISFRG